MFLWAGLWQHAVFRRLRQENCGFKVSLGHIGGHYLLKIKLFLDVLIKIKCILCFVINGYRKEINVCTYVCVCVYIGMRSADNLGVVLRHGIHLL